MLRSLASRYPRNGRFGLDVAAKVCWIEGSFTQERLMSAGKSVEFEISVKDFHVRFKGDIQSAERMHGEIAGALTSLASAQRLLTEPAKAPAPAIVNVEPTGRRRIRRRRALPAGSEAANNDGAV